MSEDPPHDFLVFHFILPQGRSAIDLAGAFLAALMMHRSR